MAGGIHSSHVHHILSLYLTVPHSYSNLDSTTTISLRSHFSIFWVSSPTLHLVELEAKSATKAWQAWVFQYINIGGLMQLSSLSDASWKRTTPRRHLYTTLLISFNHLVSLSHKSTHTHTHTHTRTMSRFFFVSVIDTDFLGFPFVIIITGLLSFPPFIFIPIFHHRLLIICSK